MVTGLVYVARRSKVRGEGGGACSALGPLKSPTPFSHLTNGRGEDVNSKSESVISSLFSHEYTASQHSLEVFPKAFQRSFSEALAVRKVVCVDRKGNCTWRSCE